jgi:protein-S-isoprenylcysteine O-methyltransferase Ste14
MDKVRYFIALITLMALPPGILMWYVVHPFGALWRRLGPWVSYITIAVISAGVMWGVWIVRRSLLSTDLGTSYSLVAGTVVVIVLASIIGLKRKRHLTPTILAGLPQVSERAYPGTLLKEGIYGTIRHPRYVEVTLWVWAYALFANFLTLYLVALATPLAIYLVILLEEQELKERFGEEWDEYAARVPRFVPARWRR